MKSSRLRNLRRSIICRDLGLTDWKFIDNSYYGNVMIWSLNGWENFIKIDIDKIYGDVNISSIGITSLEGSPEEIIGNFVCCGNQLSSFQGGPKVVTEYLNAGYNSIVDLKDVPKNKELDLRHNCLESFEGLGKHYRSLNITDNGLEYFPDKLPKKINKFNCSYNNLKSLKNGPEQSIGYYCHDNELESWEGVPKILGWSSRSKPHFYCVNNKHKLDRDELISLMTIRGNAEISVD